MLRGRQRIAGWRRRFAGKHNSTDRTEAIGAYRDVKAGVAELMARLLLAGVVCFAGNSSPESFSRRTTVMEFGTCETAEKKLMHNIRNVRKEK